jgi:hypothetical protein
MDIPDSAIPYILQPVQAIPESPLERLTEKAEAFLSEEPLQAEIEGNALPYILQPIQPPASPQVRQQQMKEMIHAHAHTSRRENQSEVYVILDKIKKQLTDFKAEYPEDSNIIAAEKHIQQLEEKANSGIEQADLDTFEESIDTLLEPYNDTDYLDELTQHIEKLSELIDTPDSGIQPSGL